MVTREQQSKQEERRVGAPTPGPWEWRFAKAGEVHQYGMRYFVGSNGQGFAHTVGLNPEEDEANARLIAAAPDLLEASRLLLQEVLADNQAIACVDLRIIEAMEKAIAKARGTK